MTNPSERLFYDAQGHPLMTQIGTTAGYGALQPVGYRITDHEFRRELAEVNRRLHVIEERERARASDQTTWAMLLLILVIAQGAGYFIWGVNLFALLAKMLT